VDVELFLDGKTLTLHGKYLNTYFQAEAGSIDAAVDLLLAIHGE
jgi:hypothetical protein